MYVVETNLDIPIYHPLDVMSQVNDILTEYVCLSYVATYSRYLGKVDMHTVGRTADNTVSLSQALLDPTSEPHQITTQYYVT